MFTYQQNVTVIEKFVACFEQIKNCYHEMFDGYIINMSNSASGLHSKINVTIHAPLKDLSITICSNNLFNYKQQHYQHQKDGAITVISPLTIKVKHSTSAFTSIISSDNSNKINDHLMTYENFVNVVSLIVEKFYNYSVEFVILSTEDSEKENEKHQNLESTLAESLLNNAFTTIKTIKNYESNYQIRILNDDRIIDLHIGEKIMIDSPLSNIIVTPQVFSAFVTINGKLRKYLVYSLNKQLCISRFE